MHIVESEYYKKSIKKIKKHIKESNNLNIIIKILLYANNINDLSKMLYYYNFERLKHRNELYSLNLSKNGGTIRLIIRFRDDYTVELYQISYKHYIDLK